MGLDRQNNNFAHARRFFSLHFFAVTAQLRRENAYFHVLTRTWTRDIQWLSFSFPSSRLLELSQAPKRDVVTAQVDYWILFHIYMMRSSLHWLLYVACCLVLRSSMMRNEGNNHQVCFFFVFFPNCCEKALTCCETTCNEMANFVAKRAVTFLISRGPGFQPLDSII